MIRRVAMVFGVVFLLLGIVGFFSPGGMAMGADPAPGKIFGLFDINLLHNIVHCVFGVWGLVASRSFSGAKSYAQVGGVIHRREPRGPQTTGDRRAALGVRRPRPVLARLRSPIARRPSCLAYAPTVSASLAALSHFSADS
jgi:hypothetical protein